MKKNDIVDLKSKTVDELNKVLFDLREEVTKIMTETTLKKVKNTNLAKSKRKDIARVMTFLSMKTEGVVEEVVSEAKKVKEGVSKT